MIPNPAEVVRRQWTVTGLFRMLALVLGLVGVLTFLMGLVFAFTIGSVDGWRRDEVLFSLFFCTGAGVVLAGLGIAVFALAGKAARTVAQYPKTVPCPRCFYGLEGLVEPRCSECGLDLTIEFLPPQQLRPATEPIAHASIRHRLVFIPIIRIGALLLAFPLGGALLGLLVSWMESTQRGISSYSIWEEPSYVAVWIWWLGSAGVVGSVLLFPRIWVRWIVPRPTGRQLDLFETQESRAVPLDADAGTGLPEDPTHATGRSEIAADPAPTAAQEP